MLENQYKRSIRDDIGRLKLLMPWIGQEKLERLHRGTLDPWIRPPAQARRFGWHDQSRLEGRAADTEPRGERMDR